MSVLSMSQLAGMPLEGDSQHRHLLAGMGIHSGPVIYVMSACNLSKEKR